MNVPPRRRSVITGLSGNEMYCLQLKGLRPGELVIGNSVHSLGFLGGIGATLQGAFGGEVTQVTDIISEGRHASFERMLREAEQRGGVGITGVTSELTHFKGNIEFLSVASALHGAHDDPEQIGFSSSGNGQELYCLMDAGYQPLKFVFGNVAYSIGLGGRSAGRAQEPGPRARSGNTATCSTPRATWPCSASSRTPSRPAPTPSWASRPASWGFRGCMRC